MTGEETKVDFVQRAAQAREAANSSKDMPIKTELLKIAEMWERLGRMGNGATAKSPDPQEEPTQ